MTIYLLIVMFCKFKGKMKKEYMYAEYISNEGKENQRIHKSYISSSSILNDIEYPKTTTPPKELLKFYNINENSVNALTNNYLWAANPLSFNDPFDCPRQLWSISSFTLETMKQLVDPKAHFLFSNDHESNREWFLKIRLASLGIISLNELQDKNQDIIWGYYTNQEGFSIKFDRHILIKQWGNPFRIEYLTPDDFDSFNIYELNTEELFPRFLRWSTQKKEVWENENEWRFIFSNLKIETLKMDAFPTERKKKYPTNAILELNLGLRFLPIENTVQFDDNSITVITDSIKHKNHNLLLTYLSDNQNIRTNHMSFKQDLKLHPRACKILKTRENRFLINYLE
ncbi:hypothetical protein ACUNWD_19465 [Sunxiuqinia sp. A32]|uniref:hypothetical protein n=1 Tax=Sunxiuqinia sp. A32 TaxID=3461496 RepID=UPI0040459648